MKEQRRTPESAGPRRAGSDSGAGMAAVEEPGGGARGRRPRRAADQPRPGLLPGPRRDQARPRRLLPVGGRRHRQRAVRAAVHAAPLPHRRDRREGAPEARPGRRAAVAGDRAAALPPLEPHRRRALRHRARAACIWAVQMSTVEFHPWNSRRADTEKPDEWRIDLDPGDRSATTPRSAGSRTSPTRSSTSSARSAGRRPAAATACTSTCGSGPTTASRTYDGRRWRSRARSSGGRPTT